MNKIHRAPYLGLTTIHLPGEGMVELCCFCRLADWRGWDCEDMDFECKHPLVGKYSFDKAAESGQGGGDCWGFRPIMAVEVAADIVGIWLQGQAVEWDSVPLIARGIA